MSMFSAEGFDGFVTQLPGVTLVDQWDSRVAKVGGKVFALLSPDEDVQALITFKCGEESFEGLTAIAGIGQAPYFAKRQWVSVARDAAFSQDELKAYVARSHGIIAKGLTRKVRQELGIA